MACADKVLVADVLQTTLGLAATELITGGAVGPVALKLFPLGGVMWDSVGFVSNHQTLNLSAITY